MLSPFTLLAADKQLDPIPVVVSIPPQKYFVEQIAGNRATVTIMVPKGFEPEDYEPRPQQLKSLTHAKLYLAIDVPFEHTWLTKFQDINHQMHVVFTNTGIQKIAMSPDAHGHYHEPLLNSNTIKDPHIWLSPRLVKIQASHIRDAFIKIDPLRTAFYQQNYQRFIKRLTQLDHKFKVLFSQHPHAAFLIFHPSLGYFAADYGITQLPIEGEGKSPTLKQLDRLIKAAKGHQISTLFISPEYAPKEAETIARAIGGKTQLIDPLSEAWFDNMQHIASSIANTL